LPLCHVPWKYVFIFWPVAISFSSVAFLALLIF
jgi:hypothetical protein